MCKQELDYWTWLQKAVDQALEGGGFFTQFKYGAINATSPDWQSGLVMFDRYAVVSMNQTFLPFQDYGN